jgi:hypothetical protein
MSPVMLKDKSIYLFETESKIKGPLLRIPFNTYCSFVFLLTVTILLFNPIWLPDSSYISIICIEPLESD